jgi:hypothetical protein
MSSSAPNHPPLFLTKIWFYFFIFTATNALLAYAPFPLEAKLWIGLTGFLLPFILGVRALSSRTGKENTILNLELFETIPSWVWWGLLILGIIFRLVPLLNSSWIFPDEGHFSQLSVELYRQWKWIFFFSDSQMPLLYNWVLALYYQFVPPSVFSTRLFIFPLGILALALSLLASRRFFSKSASLLYFVFFSVGFWPLFFCKFCMPMQPALMVQMAVFYLLGLFLASSSMKKTIWYGLGLGLAAGIGFWIYYPWILMIPMVAIAVVPKLARERTSVSIGMITSFLFLFVPFLLLSLMEKNGEHVKYLWAYYRQLDVVDGLRNLFSNWTLLFWEGNIDNEYGPVWGGFLNPMEGAFCFLGIIQFIRSRRQTFSRWMLASSFVFVIPGLLTNGYESFHNLLLLPILLVFCVCGAQGVLAAVPTSWRALGLAALVLTSSTLNLIHFEKTFIPQSSEISGSDLEYREVRRIFSILDQTHRQNGPGFILWDLSTFRERTLGFETFPFNAADNPRIQSKDVHWAAILCNSNYKSFLEPRFSGSTWHEIGPDQFWNEGHLTLAVVPFLEANRPILSDWLEANGRLHSITRDFLFDNKGSWVEDARRKLLGMEALMSNDPYLTSIFWERVISESGQRQSPGQWLLWLDQAIRRGYPAAHLLAAKGLMLRAQGKQLEAREAFNQAVRSPLNLTKASEYLRAMDEPKKKSRP